MLSNTLAVTYRNFQKSYLASSGTRLDIRLDENNLPNQGEEPINEIDRLAYIHDLAYQKSSNIQDRHRADLAMIEGLKGLQNLSFPQKLIKALIIKLFQAKIKLGHSARAAKAQAIENLYKQPKIDSERSLKSPKEWKILANELHKPFRRPKQLRKIYFRSKDNIWNADLVHMSEEDGRHGPYKYILTVLDRYTRYAWAVPLKHKDGLTVSNAFKEIMKKSERKPRKLWVDQGKEFYNEHMHKLFKFKKEDILEKDPMMGEYKNQIYSVFNFGKNPVIERFNRTLTNKLWKQFTVQGNQKWLGILQPTVDEYNNTAHSVIGITPKEASEKPWLVKIQTEPSDNNKPKFKVNDRVRIFKWKDKFEKGYCGYWTKEIF